MPKFDLSKLRPEVRAGGYCTDDTNIQFYQRINALVGPNSRVLDFGAGRSAAVDGDDPARVAERSYPFRLRYMKGRVARVVGIDIDPVVLTNPILDEAHVLRPGEPYPFADNSFDVIYCDWVLEHIEDIPAFVSEIHRILAPGGWFCARTPNKWGYISLGSTLLGDKYERQILKRLQPWRKEQDNFPKFYRLNTLGALRTAFSPRTWLHCSYFTNPTPGYHGNRIWLFRLIGFYQKIVPERLSTTLLIFLQKQ